MAELQVSVEAGEGLERLIRVTVPVERIEPEVESRLKRIGKTAKIKGFRPGKIPQKVLYQHYGVQVREEVVQEVVQKTYVEVVESESLQPAGVPRLELEEMQDGKDLIYTATVEVYPDFSVDGIDKLKVEQVETAIQDSDIDEIVDTLRRQRATFSPVSRAAAEGDQVTVDFDGSIGGAPFEGGQGREVQVQPGSGEMIPGFEEQLIGMKAGDEKSFEVTFPADYHAAELAGKTATFKVTARSVAEQSLPEIDEEFVKSFGVESGSVDEFRDQIRHNMTREIDAKVRDHVKQQVMDQLVSHNQIALPGALVNQQAESLRAEAMRTLGISDPEQAPGLEEFHGAAERNVLLGLLLQRLIKDHSIELDQDRVRAKVDEICAVYDRPDELRKMYFQNPQLLSSVENQVAEEQVVDWLVGQAKVTKKSLSVSELMKKT